MLALPVADRSLPSPSTVAMATPDLLDDDTENADNGDTEESSLQACYVLHGPPARLHQSPRNPGRPPRKSGEGGAENSKEDEKAGPSGLPACLQEEPPVCAIWRKNAFNVIWGRLERLIQATLDDLNETSFEEIKQWVCNRQFCDAQQQLYRSARISLLGDSTGPAISTKGSHIIGSFNKQLHTALLFLGGVDPSDHQDTFDGLSAYLKSHKCHVARLLPRDFPSKSQIAVPVNSLLRQFLQMNPETADMEILAAWYSEPKNHGGPVVVTVENMERCNVTVLAEFLVLLSEWAAEIPLVLILGIATTADVLQKFLPSSALSRLIPHRFTIKPPLERLEFVVRAALMDSFSAFEIGYGVAQYLCTNFSRHDLTVTSFIMSLKVACMEHFCREPLSFMSEWLLKSSSLGDLEKQCASLSDTLLEYAASLPSAKSTGVEGFDVSKQIASKLWALREQKQLWSIALQCILEVGKQSGLRFIDLFCEALRPLPASNNPAESMANSALPRTAPLSLGWQELKAKIRELTLPVLRGILEEWKKVTSPVSELHADICSVYTKILSADKIDWDTLTPSSTCRSKAPAFIPNPSQISGHQVLSKSPLRRPLFQTSFEQNGTSSLPCPPTEPSYHLRSPIEGSPVSVPLEDSRRKSSRLIMSPEKAGPSCGLAGSPRRASPQLLKSPEKGSLISSPPESPKRPSKEILKSPQKVCGVSSLAESPRRASARLSKISEQDVVMDVQQSPLRSSNRRLRSPEKVFSVSSIPESPRRTSARLLKSPDKACSATKPHGSPRRRLLNSPEKAPQVSSSRLSPRKAPKSPAKTPPAVGLRASPRKHLLQSPSMRTPSPGGSEGQLSMSRSDLRMLASRNSLGSTVKAGINPLNELVADLLERIIMQYLIPTEMLPFHEIICFNCVSSLKQATTGATRQKVQLDLLGAQLRLQCQCCPPDGSLSNSMHDTSLAFHLSQEHSELINVHDWYQSFSSICGLVKGSARKPGNKRWKPELSMDPAILQARFTRATTELQIAGLLRMPKKGRPDFAQRVGFG